MRIGGDHDHRLRRCLHQLRHDVLEHGHIGVEQAQAAGRIAAVGGAARLFVDAGGDDGEAGIGQVGIVAVADRDQGRERGAVVHVGRHGLGAGTGAVDQHDLAHPGARCRRHGDRRTDRTDADDAHFHDLALRAEHVSGPVDVQQSCPGLGYIRCPTGPGDL
jgi:hypothetical protein